MVVETSISFQNLYDQIEASIEILHDRIKNIRIADYKMQHSIRRRVKLI